MATYNGAKYLSDQINSVLCQLDEMDELIISDDGSTDGTIEIITSYMDSRIKLYRNNAHCYTLNFENALRHAHGDYVFLCDQDDIWKPNKMNTMLKYLQQYDFVVSDAEVVNQDLDVISLSRNTQFHIKNGFLRNLFKSYYLGCCMAFNRKVLDAVLPFPDDHELCKHDHWIALLSELCFKTYVCDEVLMQYRRHGNNVSSGAIGIKSDIKTMIVRRSYMLKELLRRERIIRRKNDEKNL